VLCHVQLQLAISRPAIDIIDRLPFIHPISLIHSQAGAFIFNHIQHSAAAAGLLLETDGRTDTPKIL
jgi:hypothetical protein